MLWNVDNILTRCNLLGNEVVGSVEVTETHIYVNCNKLHENIYKIIVILKTTIIDMENREQPMNHRRRTLVK